MNVTSDTQGFQIFPYVKEHAYIVDQLLTAYKYHNVSHPLNIHICLKICSGTNMDALQRLVRSLVSLAK